MESGMGQNRPDGDLQRSTSYSSSALDPLPNLFSRSSGRKGPVTGDGAPAVLL